MSARGARAIVRSGCLHGLVTGAVQRRGGLPPGEPVTTAVSPRVIAGFGSPVNTDSVGAVSAGGNNLSNGYRVHVRLFL